MVQIGLYHPDTETLDMSYEQLGYRQVKWIGYNVLWFKTIFACFRSRLLYFSSPTLLLKYYTPLLFFSLDLRLDIYVRYETISSKAVIFSYGPDITYYSLLHNYTSMTA